MLSDRQSLLLLDEAIKADGNYTNYINHNTVVYNSKRQSDIDFLSALISIHYGIANDHTRHTDGYKKIKMHKKNKKRSKTFCSMLSPLAAAGRSI